MKWKWDDENINKIASSLDHEHEGEDISEISLNDLHDLIINLNDFEGDPEQHNPKMLQVILERWREIVNSK
jgi:FeS assembly protein IscX